MKREAEEDGAGSDKRFDRDASEIAQPPTASRRLPRLGVLAQLLGEVPRYNCKGRVEVSQKGNLVRQLIYHERRNRGRALL